MFLAVTFLFSLCLYLYILLLSLSLKLAQRHILNLLSLVNPVAYNCFIADNP